MDTSKNSEIHLIEQNNDKNNSDRPWENFDYDEFKRQKALMCDPTYKYPISNNAERHDSMRNLSCKIRNWINEKIDNEISRLCFFNDFLEKRNKFNTKSVYLSYCMRDFDWKFSGADDKFLDDSFSVFEEFVAEIIDKGVEPTYPVNLTKEEDKPAGVLFSAYGEISGIIDFYNDKIVTRLSQ